MRPVFIIRTAGAALVAAAACIPLPSSAQAPTRPPAQAQQPRGQAQQPPAPNQQVPAAPAPVKPYKPVAVTPAKPFNDASFDAFRKRLVEIAQKKDRAALARLVAKDFFWEGENGEQGDKKKSGIDNLAKAIELDAKDGSGWEMIAAYAQEQSAALDPDRKGVVCSPADPDFDDQQTEALLKETETDPAEWVYPLADGVEVREKAQANSPVVEKLGLHFVRVLIDDAAGNLDQSQDFVRVATPSGKTGFVSVDQLLPLGGDQLCYSKDSSGWKIAGYVGE
jgi:hypothetical protein